MHFRELFRTKSPNQCLSELGASQARSALKRSLNVWDVTLLGIAAVLGAGIFSTVGNAASQGGPAVIFLFIFTAIACAFSALCYAEFVSAIPVSGSAYTYAYVAFGELIAWIVGWDLLLEYAIGDIVIAISWSQYFTALLAGYGIHIPDWCTLDFLTASRSYHEVHQLLSSGISMQDLQQVVSQPVVMKGYAAWLGAPRIFGFPLICDLPALLVTFLITAVVFVGIEDSKKASHFFVGLKVFVLLLVIGVGAFYVQPSHWIPFAPYGIGGVLKGASAVFFAYIGFDAISATAEECKNPQRDLPRGMIYTLLICTLLYSLLTLVLTGLVDFRKLGVGDPLAFVFGPEGVHLPLFASLIAFSAVAALSSVLLVFQLGQTRIWMAMSRDGLLPSIFSAIHPRYKTPWVSTLVAGLLVAIPSLFMNLSEVTDLNSIGTLFAFLLVCGGSLKLQAVRTQKSPGAFRMPYWNSRYIFPVGMICISGIFGYWNPVEVREFFSLAGGLSGKIPMLVYIISMMILSYFCYTRSLSLIPVLGLSTCGYLMTELGMTNWLRFGIWLLVGFCAYFCYGVKHSRMRTGVRQSILVSSGKNQEALTVS